ncbi:unnamed protein product [Bursaphelenchus okinawaensis]|uniref:Metalloendopeptidase n=1 Tax=Bursaphelenchus okinawaensis TaxID=465554 RepID=A0A811KCA8_9BILA|nr:unnamed protein product [Bursaphelenchus okinawaensis]CAG9100798.1 unnamed protein product [Bursaphelenchus okinawaensis]
MRPLAVVFLICLGASRKQYFAVDTSPVSPNFLTDDDFRNAEDVDITKPMKIILNDQHFHKKRVRRGSVVSFETDKWPNGRVPYVLSTQYTQQQRAVLARSMAAYSAKTCIKFVPKEARDKDYIVIQKLDGCYADFARVGGRQQVSLADECIDYATIIHELMHVIGFIHEHQRDDRDQFVKINWKNVIDGANADFDKISSQGLSNYGEGYDYFSIMHYESTEGSKNGKNTIESKRPGFTSLMGKSTDFTRGDLTRINKAYQCYRGTRRHKQKMT